jgi:hypothetical protein
MSSLNDFTLKFLVVNCRQRPADHSVVADYRPESKINREAAK